MAFHIPETILLEILSRLPVKSLIRFKCVCKLWYSLITSPELASMHLNNNDSTHLLFYRQSNAKSRQVMSLLSPTMDTNSFAIDFDLPKLGEFFGQPQICDPCNGIVCIYGDVDRIALWNPATKEFKQVPTIKSSARPPPAYRRIGFGFDAETSNYKILQIVGWDANNVKFELYSLRGDSWKELEPAICVPHIEDILGATLLYENRNIICWLTRGAGGDKPEIVCFDMRDEEFGIIQLPPDIVASKVLHPAMLFPCRESVALIHTWYMCRRPRDNDRPAFFDIWLSENFFASGGNSWLKWASIRDVDVRPLRFTRLQYVWPLRFCENGHLLFVHFNKEIILYDPITQETKHLDLDGFMRTSKVFAFKESLVAISQSQGSSCGVSPARPAAGSSANRKRRLPAAGSSMKRRTS